MKLKTFKLQAVAKNDVETQIIASHLSVRYNTHPPSLPPLHSKFFLLGFEHGLVLLATLTRGGEGITGKRSWTSHLSQKIIRYWVSQVPSNFENKPRGLYFSKPPFEGLIFGGAYLRREICIDKLIGLGL